MSDHERIWLQPECCAGVDGRLWCEDPDAEDCPDGKPWTEYVRADLLAAAEARVAELEWAIARIVGQGKPASTSDDSRR